MPRLRGLLGMVVLLVPWPAGPLMLPTFLAIVGWPFGAMGLVVAMAIMVFALSVNSNAGRFAACAAVLSLALAAPVAKMRTLLSGVWVCVMILMCCFTYPPWPKFRRFLMDPSLLSAKTYFAACFVRADWKGFREEKTFIAFHPHGIFSSGFTLNACFDAMFLRGVKKMRFLIDGTLRYKNPFFKVVIEWCTTPEFGWDSADKATLLKHMATGMNIGLIPGGFQDATVYSFGRERICLRERKGFVKYCLQYGYRLHPAYTFGESRTFFAAQGLLDLRLKLNGWGIPTIAPFGWSLCPLLPRPQARLVTYVGEALEVPHIPVPTAKDVDEWHGKYVAALQALFDGKKAEAGYPDAILEIL